MKSHPSWYGVKTLYRTTVQRSARQDSHAPRSKHDLIEERVVILRARTVRDALRRAESEARVYARARHRNPWNQVVRTRFLGWLDAHELPDPPSDVAEVFSQTEIIGRKISDWTILTRRFGTEQERDRPLRHVFCHREFTGKARMPL